MRSENVKTAPHKHGFETIAIHAGQDPEGLTGAVVVPIFQTSTFAQEAVGKNKGYEYARTGNPTRTALETCLAALEGARWGLAFASGMAASDAVAHLLSKGDHVVMADDVYGGTYRLTKPRRISCVRPAWLWEACIRVDQKITHWPFSITREYASFSLGFQSGSNCSWR